jgi:hypothetical protein
MKMFVVVMILVLLTLFAPEILYLSGYNTIRYKDTPVWMQQMHNQSIN